MLHYGRGFMTRVSAEIPHLNIYKKKKSKESQVADRGVNGSSKLRPDRTRPENTMLRTELRSSRSGLG